MKEKVPKLIRPYYFLGFHENGDSGDNVFGDCIFCGRTNKLWIHSKTGEYRCWSSNCSKHGNVTTFIRDLYNHIKSDSVAQKLAPWDTLSKLRGIPAQALRDAGLVFRGPDWLIPVYNMRGEISSLCTYVIGGRKKVSAIWGLPTNIFGLDTLNDSESKTVAIVEGPWDAISLRHNLCNSNNELSASVIGVPGAGVFKDEWTPLFKGYRVIFCYDADTDGEKGAQAAGAKLFGTARDLQRISWNSDAPKGYDVSNYFKDGGTVSDLIKLIVPLKIDTTPSQKNRTYSLKSKKRPTFTDVLAAYKKHLKLGKQQINGIRVCYATVLSNLLPGDPVWTYIVGPSGSAKTEILRSFDSVSHCLFRSTVSANSLISGFRGPENKDPSLIPQLDGKTFLIKDMTVLLRKPPKDKDEVFSILRDAYDGFCSKSVGNGPAKEFKSKFSMLAGVTPAIYAEIQSALGERFILYEIYNTLEGDDTEIITSAAKDEGNEDIMREELRKIAVKYCEVMIEKSDIPEIPDHFLRQIVALAQITAMLRGTVQRDKFTERLLYRPSAEMGTRLVKQFMKLARGLALLNRNFVFTEKEYNIIKTVAINTCIGFNMDIMRVLLAAKQPVSGRDLVDLANIPGQTLNAHLKDMLLLGALDTITDVDSSGRSANFYIPSQRITNYIGATSLNGRLLLPKKDYSAEIEEVE